MGNGTRAATLVQAVARALDPLQLLHGLDDPEPVNRAVAVAVLDPLVGAQARFEGRIEPVFTQEQAGRLPDLTIEHADHLGTALS